MILITGAGGKTGRAIVKALAARPGAPAVRALVRTEAQVAPLQALGAAEALAGDMRAASTYELAMRGVQTVYHICPNVSPDEVALGQAALAAARQAGVAHFVYHSVLHPQTPSMPHHWNKLHVEAALFEAGLGFTILQPAAYMQNVLASWPAILNEGVYRVPYPVSTRLGMVDLEDVAEAAAIVLAEPGPHNGAIYELCGAEALDQTEVAAAFSRALGRPVRAEQTPIDAWLERARASGLGDYQIETLLKMFDYYANYGLWGNPRALAGLLGRAPGGFEAFVRRHVDDDA